MRISVVVLGLWLLMVAVAGAQEPEPTVYDPIGSFEEPGDSGFTALFWLFVPLALFSAYVGLRRDWHAGSFFGRSRVDVTDRPDLPLRSATAVARKPSAEERLAEIERLKAKGLITDEEHAKLRADVLADVTRD